MFWLPAFGCQLSPFELRTLMPRLSKIGGWLALPVLLVVFASMPAAAQDDANEAPLGDVAREFRNKKNPPAQKPVIDDDNLSQVMEQGASKQSFGSSLRYLMGGDSKGFQVAAPDVTCSLSFTANVKSLLSSQYSQMNLPAPDLVKLEGPATIEGDALSVSVFNATTWHVSEVTVALTVVKKSHPEDGSSGVETPAGSDAAFQEVRPEKKQDVTVIYRMRAAAPPWARAVFSAPLNMAMAPGEEWHWAIVEARGYPPQVGAQTAAMQSNDPSSNRAASTMPSESQTPDIPSSLQTPQ